MASYLLIASDLPALDGPALNARDVFDLMHKHRCWEFPPTGQQAKLKEGDLLLFYLGSKVKHIVGQATVAGPAVPIKKDSPITFDRDRFPFFVWRIPLQDFVLYPSAGADLDFLMQLSFAKGSKVTRPYVGLLLRVGMRTLTAEDITLIQQAAGAPMLPQAAG